MASIIMHLCVNKVIASELNVGSDFLFGSIMPDISKSLGVQKSQSHYTFGAPDKYINLDRYIKENIYSLQKHDERQLGYLAHLIQDKIWFEKYVIADNMTHEHYYSIAYPSYPIIDKYLLKYNNLELEQLKSQIISLKLDSKTNDIIQNIKLGEVTSDKILLNLTFEDIILYQEECIENCINRIKEFGDD